MADLTTQSTAPHRVLSLSESFPMHAIFLSQFSDAQVHASSMVGGDNNVEKKETWRPAMMR
jgi:hypothetical protein